MNQFHVVRLTGDVLERCRHRGQHQIHGHRGCKAGLLYITCRALRTGAYLHGDRQY